MKLYNNADPSVLRHHYAKKLLEMEQEKKILQVLFCGMISRICYILKDIVMIPSQYYW